MPWRALGSVNSAVKASGAIVFSWMFSPILVPADCTAVASREMSWPIELVAMVRVLPLAPASLTSWVACAMSGAVGCRPSSAVCRVARSAVDQTALAVSEVVGVPLPPRPVLTNPVRSIASESALRTRASPSGPCMLVMLTLTVLRPSPK